MLEPSGGRSYEIMAKLATKATKNIRKATSKLRVFQPLKATKKATKYSKSYKMLKKLRKKLQNVKKATKKATNV